jgi:hypothetical protein
VNELFYGLLFLILTGVTWLAYKHQQNFPPFAFTLIVILGIVLFTMQSWNLALIYAKGGLRDVVDFSNLSAPGRDAIRESIESREIPLFWFCLCGGILAYTFFLSNILPKLVNDNDDEKANEDSAVSEN